MRLNKYLNNVKCVVINLKERNDKRNYIKKHLKLQNFDYTFFDATKHSNPKRGCLESHLTVIQQTLDENKKLDEKNKIKYLLILDG
jgi:GR25 family glycosyltransferase involved in LPS biosynthesis